MKRKKVVKRLGTLKSINEDATERFGADKDYETAAYYEGRADGLALAIRTVQVS